MEIPLAAEDITPEWLTEVLREGEHLDGGRVVSARLERVGASSGFVGDVTKATLEYSDGQASGPASVVIKTAVANESIRAFARRRGLYEREVRVLTELRDDIGIATPYVYYGRFDQATGRFVLVLEDVSHLRVGDEMVGESLADAGTAVRALAGFHARWWNSPRLESLNWLDRLFNRQSAMGRQLDFRDARNKIERQLREHLDPEVFRIGESLADGLSKTWTSRSRLPLTLNHGDYRFANMFLGPDGVVMLDWQYALHGPPAVDLADFLVWSLTTDQRRWRENDLVDLYLGEMDRLGVTAYSREQLVNDIRLGMLRNLENYVTSITNLAMTDEAGIGWIEAMSPRMIALAEWDCGALIVSD